MSRRIVVLLVALGGFAVQAQESGSTVVIESGTLSITKAEFEQLANGDPRYRAALAEPATRRAVGQEFGKAFALEVEARRLKIDQKADVQLRIRNYAQQLLGFELLLNLRAKYMSDEPALLRYYEAHRDDFDQPRVRQLLVRAKGSPIALRPGAPDLSEEAARTKANALRARLAAGADFAALASAESDDTGSRDKGGDMGLIARGSTEARFETAAYSVPVGKLSDVIKTPLGFHILRVEARQPLALASVKPIIANDLAHKEMDAIILKGYKLNETYFGK